MNNAVRGILAAAFTCVVIASMEACSPPGTQGGVVADYPAEPVVYAHLGPGNTRLMIADGDGGNATPVLANSAFDYNPSLSRDGQWVIFTSERGGSPDIYRVRVDGTGLEQLTDDLVYDDYGVLSPDGMQLAFVSSRGNGNANVWLLDLASRELTNLTADLRATIARRGLRMAARSHSRPSATRNRSVRSMIRQRRPGSSLSTST